MEKKSIEFIKLDRIKEVTKKIFSSKRNISILIIVLIVLLTVGYKIYTQMQYNSNISDITQLETANNNTQNALKIQFRNDIKCDISQSKNGNFVGYVYNNSIKDIQDMTITISFYDKNDSKLGEQLIIINGLNQDENYKVDEILWSKYKSAKSWKITNKDITFTDSDYN